MPPGHAASSDGWVCATGLVFQRETGQRMDLVHPSAECAVASSADGPVGSPISRRQTGRCAVNWASAFDATVASSTQLLR